MGNRKRKCRSLKSERSCHQCGAKRTISDDSYAVNVARNGQYFCHKCGIARARAAGLYDIPKEQRSATSKSLWKDQLFRDKVTAASAAAVRSEDNRAKQSARTRDLWLDEAYACRVATAIRKKFADDPSARERVSAGLRRKWAEYDYRLKQANANAERAGHTSSIQTSLYNFLDDLGVGYHKEGQNTVIGPYAFDCLIPASCGVAGGRHILVECQGDYWHTRPDAVRRDKAKFTYIDRYFPDYEVMYVWEHEFSSKDRVLDRLKLKLGINIETVNFEFTEIRISEVTYADIRPFLDSYHYIGSGRTGKCFSVSLNDKLVGAAVFSAPVRQGTATAIGAECCVELARFCIHPSYHKKNFASWLLSRFVKYFDIPIVAFSDSTVGHRGTIYMAANFTKHHDVEPDYWYTSTDGFVMHKKTLYNRAVKAHMTEAEFARQFGYFKKCGGPKSCFVYWPR